MADINKDLLINLKIQADDGNQAVAKQLSKQIVDIEKQALKEVGNALQQSVSARNSSMKSVVDGTKKSTETVAKLEKKATAGRAVAAKQQIDTSKVVAENEINEAKRTTDSLIKQIRIREKTNIFQRKKQAALSAAKRKQDEKSHKAELGRINELKRARADLAAKDRAEDESNLQGFKGFAAGAIVAAEGLAMIGVVSQDNAEQMAKYFIVVKSGFSILSGTIDMYSNLSKAVQHMSKVKKAELVVNELMIASNGKLAASNAGVAASSGTVATASVASAGSKVASSVAGGGASAVGGAAAAGGGLIVGLKALGGKLVALATGPVATLLAVGTVLGTALFEGVQGVRRFAGATGESSESFIGAIFSWRKAVNDAEESTKKIEQLEIARDKRRENIAQKNEQATKQAGFSASVRSENRSNLQKGLSVSGGSDRESNAQLFLADIEELKAAENELSETRKRAQQRQKSGQAAIVAEEIAAIQRVKTARENLLTTEKQRIELLKRANEETKNNVQSARDELKVAREKAETERDAFDSKLAQFGQLSRAQQEELKAIAKKVKAGEEISEREAQVLGKSGFGGKIAQDRFKKSGVEAGGSEVLGVLGESEDREKANREAVAKAKRLQNAEIDQDRAQKAVAQAQTNAQTIAGSVSQATAQQQQAVAQREGVDVPGEGGNQEFEAIAGNVSTGAQQTTLAAKAMGETFVSALDDIKSEFERTQETIHLNR